MEDTSPTHEPIVHGYTKVTPIELALMVKVELANKEITKKKKNKEPQPNLVINELTDYPNFFSEHTMKEITLLEHPT